MDCEPKEKYRSRLPFPSPGDLSNPGIKPVSLTLADGVFTTEPPGKPLHSLPSCRSLPKLPSYTADLTSSLLWSSGFLGVSQNSLECPKSFPFFFFLARLTSWQASFHGSPLQTYQVSHSFQLHHALPLSFFFYTTLPGQLDFLHSTFQSTNFSLHPFLYFIHHLISIHGTHI